MITLRVKEAKSWRDKTIGLIGKDKPFPLFLTTRFGIHTFGLKFPIDILILDKSDRVVKIRSGLKHNSLFFWNPMYKKVLELPEGTINKLRINKQEKIQIQIQS